MKNKLHAVLLCFITPGIFLAWVFLIFPFHVWDSFILSWYPEFMNDFETLFEGIKNKWKEK